MTAEQWQVYFAARLAFNDRPDARISTRVLDEAPMIEATVVEHVPMIVAQWGGMPIYGDSPRTVYCQWRVGKVDMIAVDADDGGLLMERVVREARRVFDETLVEASSA